MLVNEWTGRKSKTPGMSAGRLKPNGRWPAKNYASERLPAACLPRSVTTS
jgi:hypothetical protein